jgi:hypothetical protein
VRGSSPSPRHGIELNAERAEQVAAEVAPMLERFDALVADLWIDDDISELRRRLAEEAGG